MKYNPSEALEKARKILAKKEESLVLMKELVRRLEMEAAWPELIGSGGISIAGVDGDEWWIMDVAGMESVRVSVVLSPDSMLQEYSKHPRVDLKYVAMREMYRRRNNLRQNRHTIEKLERMRLEMEENNEKS